MMKKMILISSAAALFACSGDATPYDASGIFEATETIVAAKSSGEILSLKMEEGDKVNAGDTVGVIDTMQLSLSIDQLKALIRANKNKLLDEKRQLSALKQQIENQKKERVRYEKLVSGNALPQKQLDDIDYKISVLEEELTAAEEKLRSSNASLQSQNQSLSAQIAQMENKIWNALIISPQTGTVLAKYAEPGEFAAPGRALFKIADISKIKLRAYVTAPQLTQVKMGQKVKVFADNGESGRKEYEGTVVWISDQAEFTPKTIQTRDERANLVYAIKIAVKNDGFIKRGMYGEVQF